MRVLLSGLSNIGLPNFRSRVVYEDSKIPLTGEQKRYIDKFEENQVSDYKFLGEGVTSKAYYSNSQDFVIKQNKKNSYVKEKSRNEAGSLAHENKILLSIDPHVATTQRGIAYVETEKGGKYLLSTFASGKPLDTHSNPFTPKHIDRLLRNLYRLDKSNIIHSDLSRPNLLLNTNYDVNIIDYQWAEKFALDQPYNNYLLSNSQFPKFEAPNNWSMLESAALPGYMRGLNENNAQDFLKMYLKTKSHYTDKKAEKLRKLVPDYSINKGPSIDFEKAKTKAYLSGTSDVLTAELLKMNMLNAHRRQFSCHDANKIDDRNVLRAIPLMAQAKEYANKLSSIRPKYSGNDEYFEYMNKLGKFWQEKFANWYPDTVEWILKMVSGVERPHSKVVFPEEFNDFSNLGMAKIKDYSSEKGSIFGSLFGNYEFKTWEKELISMIKNSYNKTSEYYNKSSKVCQIAKEAFRII